MRTCFLLCKLDSVIPSLPMPAVKHLEHKWWNSSALHDDMQGEALTNLVWAQATSLQDIKASVNWMYAAKMGGEGAAMYAAAEALRYAGSHHNDAHTINSTITS